MASLALGTREEEARLQLEVRRNSGDFPPSPPDKQPIADACCSYIVISKTMVAAQLRVVVISAPNGMLAPYRYEQRRV